MHTNARASIASNEPLRGRRARPGPPGAIRVQKDSVACVSVSTWSLGRLKGGGEVERGGRAQEQEDEQRTEDGDAWRENLFVVYLYDAAEFTFVHNDTWNLLSDFNIVKEQMPGNSDQYMGQSYM